MESTAGMMDQDKIVNGMRAKLKAWELKADQMFVKIKVCGQIIIWIVFESIFVLLVVFTLKRIKMMKNMGMVSINRLMIVCIMDIEVMVNSMDQEFKKNLVSSLHMVFRRKEQ